MRIFLVPKILMKIKKRIIHSYTHWHIITNLFPYDKIAQTHDMLVPKRTFGKMSECNKDEWDESKQLSLNSRQMPTMMQFLENFSRNRSVSKHLHLHLLVWKEE